MLEKLKANTIEVLALFVGMTLLIIFALALGFFLKWVEFHVLHWLFG